MFKLKYTVMGGNRNPVFGIICSEPIGTVWALTKRQAYKKAHKLPASGKYDAIAIR